MTWFTPSPIADEWEIPPGQGVSSLIKYLLAKQRREYNKTILDQFSYAILTRNMKLLRTDYSDDDIKRAIALACLVADYPFSTKLIKEQLRWLQATRSSPIQKSFQNKS